MSFRSTFYATVAIILILVGFLPNVWKSAPYTFTVPPNATTDLKRYQPGTYEVNYYMWYVITVSVVTDANGNVIEWHLSDAYFTEGKKPVA
jgi:hypothetical protein